MRTNGFCVTEILSTAKSHNRTYYGSWHCLKYDGRASNINRIAYSKLNRTVKKHSDWLKMRSDFTWNSLQFPWLWNDFENSARELLNNETENWKLNKIDVLRSIQGMQGMSFPRVQFSFFFSFPVEHAPEPPYIIRAFGADNRLVSKGDTSA